MRILLVNDFATPVGGAELLILSLRDGLRRRGHDARLFASSAGRESGESFADYECFGTTSPFRTLLQTANPWAMRRLRKVLAEFQPDVVHVKLFLTQLSPLILPLLRKVPSLYHVAWYRPICPLGTKMLPDGEHCQTPPGLVCYRNQCLPPRDWAPLMFQMSLWRRWRNAFNLIVANSYAVRDRLIAEGIEPVEVVWNGVPIQPWRPPLSSPPMVAFAGRLVLEKGADVLLRAFARIVERLPEAQLLLAGDGPERDHLQKMIAELRISSNVNMLGHLTRQQLERYLAPAWVQAVPSRWAEPFGIVATEALMRGTAVVVTNTGGLREILQDGSAGVLVPPGDADALAEALHRLLKDRQLAERMGRAGRAVAQAKFSEAVYVDRFARLYERLCRGK
jgi:glycosyltransferase involved in cell wall biosynthesis